MRPPIDGGTLLITGASAGIGRAIARELSARAGRLVLVARREDRLRALAQELQAALPDLPVHVVPCDLTDHAARDAMLERVATEAGPVDVLVNNAGVGQMGMFDASDWAWLERLITLNVTAALHLAHRLLPSMLARGRGGILNVSSGFGLEFMPGFAGYAGAKHFVSAFSESLRLEVRDRGVVVTHLCPGPVETEFIEVMGNPAGREPPALVRISAERCARIAVRGFDRGRALVVPGVAMKLLLGLGAVSPRFLKRFLYRPIAPTLRRLEASQGRAPGT
ncbi:MAG: SDR family NAD(P)-dependent oxidoreductase [Myxococcota bacterium]